MSMLMWIFVILLSLLLVSITLFAIIILCCMGGDFDYYNWAEHKQARATTKGAE